MQHKTLLLTKSFTPYKTVTWDKAISIIFIGKAEIIEEFDEVIGIIRKERINDFKQVAKAYRNHDMNEDLVLRIPSIIRLTRGSGTVKNGVKFSRGNVFARDGFRCMYCGIVKRERELNFDHVIPRHIGGKTTWENIVTSCYKCNGFKANRTPDQAGMKLLKLPYKPSFLPVVTFKLDKNTIPKSWIDYCHGHLF